MIKLQQVSKYYGEFAAVNNISLEIPKGKTTVLLGTSGSGKTTTLKMLNRLVAYDEGEIFFEGKSLKSYDLEQFRRKTGYVIQHIGLFPHYTVGENIGLVPKLLKWDKEQVKQRISELLIKLHLPQSFYSKFPHQLSGGQQQRVGLARALAAKPEIILMDEPFGALDPITRQSIRHEFKTLDELKNKTIVMVTHDVQEAFEMGDVICLMDKGKIVQYGTSKELLFQPADQFVSKFFQAQRFQLLIKTLRLKDIAENLKSDSKQGSSGAIYTTLKDTLESVMQEMSQNQTSTGIKIKTGESFVYTTFDKIMSAFQRTLKQH